MKYLSKLQTIGLFIAVISLLLGMGGTVFSIYGSFDALDAAESSGIGRVRDEIRNAIYFTGVGLLGAVLGGILIIGGRRRSS